MNAGVYFAHSANRNGQKETLREHLEKVARRAAAYARIFDAEDEARLAGLLHDLGKYSERFQLRLEGKEKGLDHWSMGAFAALMRGRLRTALGAALAIQGHHIGLQDGGERHGCSCLAQDCTPKRLSCTHPLGLVLTESDVQLLFKRFDADDLILPELMRAHYDPKAPPTAGMLDVRMLFSALVDADFIETEAHFEAGTDEKRRYRGDGPPLEASRALKILERHLSTLSEEARKGGDNPRVLKMRSDLLSACKAKAEEAPGLFTLTAPTGSGKTLAMLAFALKHARKHGLRRIVTVIPFLSIIEQTVGVYRKIFHPPDFNKNYVLENHSLAGTRRKTDEDKGGTDLDDAEEARRMTRLLAQNWDAPLIVTTSVQCLESLFANRPGACRKLHRLAKSVILFDEVQTLPPHLAVPTLATLTRLTKRYGSTVVFATATQPAFEHLSEKVREYGGRGWRPREIVPREAGLFGRIIRVKPKWRTDEELSWDALADELARAENEQLLCIVNLRAHAVKLAERLKERETEGLFHLSTNMCPAHRKDVLNKVRERLQEDRPCRLISTQCVEAGVDVDFPVVFRAFGPLEAIAQAAGRCNRNGKRPQGGVVHVFTPEIEPGETVYPPGGYKEAADTTKTLLRARGAEGLDINDPQTYERYYKTHYDLSKIGESRSRDEKDLDNAMRQRDFEETARLYRLIKQDAINVLVPYDPEAFAALRDEIKKAGRLTRDWIRSARPHTVSLFAKAKDRRDIEPLPAGRDRKGHTRCSDEWFVLFNQESYDRELLGFKDEKENWVA